MPQNIVPQQVFCSGRFQFQPVQRCFEIVPLRKYWFPIIIQYGGKGENLGG
ncbi:hypothetical protein GCM10011385_40400 [Nitratireductor aestuarii]|uniref:Uncharacterized protein n=1 Tax=Nitratireductor aestuarii TaxID=1735103 RepID=A0A916S3C7_9HYPH|nr:hypothetical protein GCM10011385_40400 [Nitratireductor aestuarii]